MAKLIMIAWRRKALRPVAARQLPSWPRAELAGMVWSSSQRPSRPS
jgi:hypothetical protein